MERLTCDIVSLHKCCVRTNGTKGDVVPRTRDLPSRTEFAGRMNSPVGTEFTGRPNSPHRRLEFDVIPTPTREVGARVGFRGLDKLTIDPATD
jgi:hypothetical protein